MNAKGTGLPHADGKDVPRDGERRCDGLLWAGGPALCGSGLNGNAFGGQCAWVWLPAVGWMRVLRPLAVRRHRGLAFWASGFVVS